MLLYRTLLTLALAVYAPLAFLRQALGRREIGDWRSRLGLGEVPRLPGSIWVHGVSVGEVAAARPILAALRREGWTGPLALSASTAAGLRQAQAAPEADAALAFPVDLRRPVERALDALSPRLVLLVETEIWPLLLERCSRRGIPVAIVNGRVSDRSFARYRLVARWLAGPLSRIALFLVQSDRDAERFASLGAPRERIRVEGSVKFDLPVPAPGGLREEIVRLAAGRRIVVAGSTHPGEEESVVAAWRALSPKPFLVVAPRRPERFGQVLDLLRSGGFRVARRTEGAVAADVLLLDTVGELSAAYAAADAAFIGGTLAPVGGHNPIEAWASGVPTLLGPHTENLGSIAQDGISAGAAEAVPDGAALGEALARWLADARELSRRGCAARGLVERRRGASDRIARAALALAGAG